MKIGVVVEGFNEGERLRRCLTSLSIWKCTIVYVDSGSNDGSIEYAASQGCDLVHLDVSEVPFSCSRARNAGFRKLLGLDPAVDVLQFVDADCEIAAGWLDVVRLQFEKDRQLGVLCGRLTERDRDSSIYRRLCDMEWDGPIGEVATCGGIAAMRADAFAKLGGFCEDLGGDEEIELCRRMRGEGFRVVRTSEHMATHDANMTEFRQWWRRAVKHGSVYAQAVLQGRGDSYKRRQCLRAIWWGAVLPLCALVALVFSWFWPALGIAIAVLPFVYAALAWRASGYRRSRGNSVADSWLYGVFCVLSNWAYLAGFFRYARNRRHLASATS